MSSRIVRWVRSPFQDHRSRHTTLTGASQGILIGLGLAVAAHTIGIASGRAVIKLGYATVAGLAVGETVISRRAGSEGQLYEPPDPTLRAVGATVGLALTIVPYTLQPLLLTMFQATVGAVLNGVSVLLGVGWILGSERDHGRRWDAMRLAGTGLIVVGLAVLIPN